MKAFSLWVFAAAVALGLFLGLNPGVYTNFENGALEGTDALSLGEIIEVRGSTLSKSQSQDFFHSASAGQKVFPLDRILTGFDSEVLLNIGETFWLLPNSQVKIAREGRRTEVHLLAGSLKRTNKGSKAKFFVSGVLSNAMVVKKGELSSLTKLPFENFKMETMAATEKPLKLVGINEKQIHQNFRLHQKFIEKCFIAHYASASGKTKSGKVWLRFKIAKNGSVESPSVSRSDYRDEKFHNCLENVVARVRIKGYKGPKAQVEFPIDIKLPQDIKAPEPDLPSKVL